MWVDAEMNAIAEGRDSGSDEGLDGGSGRSDNPVELGDKGAVDHPLLVDAVSQRVQAVLGLLVAKHPGRVVLARRHGRKLIEDSLDADLKLLPVFHLASPLSLCRLLVRPAAVSINEPDFGVKERLLESVSWRNQRPRPDIAPGRRSEGLGVDGPGTDFCGSWLGCSEILD